MSPQRNEREEGGPLDPITVYYRRAWTFQEYLFSRRRVMSHIREGKHPLGMLLHHLVRGHRLLRCGKAPTVGDSA
jgi:hypothetical protein